MTMLHAVVWIDHQSAKIHQFNAEQVQAQQVKAHSHPTAQHGSVVRSEHEFFGHVCDALAGIPEVWVVGPKTGINDFEHYARKHRPETARHLVGFEVVDHPSDNQLVAMARKFFFKHDRMNGVPTPT
jgi:stalled ribosome rescue protein Dom34